MNITKSIVETTTEADTCLFSIVDPTHAHLCNRYIQISYGSFLTAFSTVCLVGTILVVYANYKAGNLSKNSSSIFILSTWSLVNSRFILFFIAAYIGPTILFQVKVSMLKFFKRFYNFFLLSIF